MVANRSWRFFSSYAEYDGFRGVVLALKGAKVRVDVESANKGRSGGMDVPLEALKPLKPA